MTNKEKFLLLVSGHCSRTMIENSYRIKNRRALRMAQHIALRVLFKMDELNITAKELAPLLGFTKPKTKKILQGKNINLDLKSIAKIEEVLGITLFNQIIQ